MPGRAKVLRSTKKEDWNAFTTEGTGGTGKAQSKCIFSVLLRVLSALSGECIKILIQLGIN